MLGNVLGNRELRCDASQLYTVQPLAGQRCDAYLADYVSSVGGYVSNPSATSNCGFCTYSNGNEYLQTAGLSYGDRWPGSSACA